MAIKQKQRNDFDKLFEDLGVLGFGEGVDVPQTDIEKRKALEVERLATEDPYARFLEPTKSGKEPEKKD